MTTRIAAGFALALLLAAPPLAGCNRYTKAMTPPGKVPPVPAGQAPVAAQGTIRDRQEMQEEDLSLPTDRRFPSAERTLASAELVAGFRRAYASAGRPRLAVYMNRELSDNVREWEIQFGATWTEEGNEWTAGTTKSSEFHTGPADEGTRPAPGGEGWMWAFEHAFIQPLLEADATLVDRSVILRRTAADAASDGSDYASLSAKKVEIEALVGYADVLVEVRVLRSPAAPWGFEFRATAKDVETGAILASVMGSDLVNLGIPASLRTPSAGYDAAEGGYERKPPSVEAVAAALASRLMESLADRWS